MNRNKVFSGYAIAVCENQVITPRRYDRFIENTALLKPVIFLPNVLNRTIRCTRKPLNQLACIFPRPIIGDDDFKVVIRLGVKPPQHLLEPQG